MSTGKIMVTEKFNALVVACGGLSGFAKHMNNLGFSTFSHATVGRWYSSNNKHPTKKYLESIRVIAKLHKIKITTRDVR
ncbi:hypothetical protein [Dickeya phage Sucellus]|nr:hypothetical protein [Dickeya phage Sucellus]